MRLPPKVERKRGGPLDIRPRFGLPIASGQLASGTSSTADVI